MKPFAIWFLVFVLSMLTGGPWLFAGIVAFWVVLMMFLTLVCLITGAYPRNT